MLEFVFPTQTEDRRRDRAHDEQEKKAKRPAVSPGMARCRS